MFKRKSIDQRRKTAAPQPSNVFSYYSSRSNPDVSRGRYERAETDRRGAERLKHTPTLIAVILIVVSMGYASIVEPQPRIQVVASESGKSLQRDDGVYHDFVADHLSRSVFNRSKLTFNAEPLVDSLRREYPEIDNAVVTLPLLGHKPVVRIAVSSPIFILATNQGSYYINGKGVPLVRVSDVKNQPEGIAVITDETGLPIELGTQVLTTDSVLFIGQLIEQLVATNTPYQQITLPLEANEVQIRLQGKPYVVRLNSLQNARTQIGTFLAVKQRLQGEGVTPKEYIDVRVEERAYYK